jgi:toxin ParE1/3/4
MTRYRITRHPLVERDLDTIQDYIAPFAGVGATLRIMREIRQRITDLAGVPHIGTVRNDVVPGLRAIPAAEKAVVSFTVNNETHTVKIICVTYAGQDWQTIAREREA